MNDVEHFLRIIDEELARSGESDRALSLRGTSSGDTIRNARRHLALPNSKNLRGLADALHLTVDQLIGRTAPSDAPRAIEALPAHVGDVTRTFRQAPNDLPVYGTAHGHDISFGDNGKASVEVTLFEPGERVRFVARPPSLIDQRDAYALYVQGDSMFPAHKPGALVVVNPRQPPAIGDDVIVQLRAPIDDGEHGEEVVSVLIKTLTKRSSEYIELFQYRPECTFRVERHMIAAIHRVVPPGEWLGG